MAANFSAKALGTFSGDCMMAWDGVVEVTLLQSRRARAKQHQLEQRCKPTYPSPVMEAKPSGLPHSRGLTGVHDRRSQVGLVCDVRAAPPGLRPRTGARQWNLDVKCRHDSLRTDRPTGGPPAPAFRSRLRAGHQVYLGRARRRVGHGRASRDTRLRQLQRESQVTPHRTQSKDWRGCSGPGERHPPLQGRQGIAGTGGCKCLTCTGGRSNVRLCPNPKLPTSADSPAWSSA